MALILSDRVKETTSTTGTGTYTLAGAATGFESFGSIGNSNTTYYCCTDGTDFEVGIGTYTASGTTLARTTILQSSNSDNAVSWTSGTRQIFCTLPAEKSVVKDASNNINGTFVGNITGNVTGNVSGTAATVTGAAQTNITSLGTLTTLTVDDITINGSTISDGADLTLDAEGDIILDANGAEIRLKDNGTEFGSLRNDSSDFLIRSAVADKDIKIQGVDGSSTINALTFDMSDAGAATFNHDVTATGNFNINSAFGYLNFYDSTGQYGYRISGRQTTSNGLTDSGFLVEKQGGEDILKAYSSDNSVYANQFKIMRGTLELRANNGSPASFKMYDSADTGSPKYIEFLVPSSGVNNTTLTLPTSSGTLARTSDIPSTALDDITTGDAAVTLATSSGNITIDAQGSNTDIIFKGTDGASDTTALTLDMSDQGKALFNSGATFDGTVSNFGGSFSSVSDNTNALKAGLDLEISLQHREDTGFRLTNSGTGTPAVELEFVDSNESVGSDGTNLLLKSGGNSITVPNYETGKINLSPAKKRFASQQDFLSKNVGNRYKYVTPLSGYYYSQFTWYANRAFLTPWVINGNDDHGTVTVDEVAIRSGFNQSGYGGGTCLIGMFDLNEFGAPDNLLYETTVTIPANVGNNTTISSSALTWAVKPGVYAMIARVAGNNLVCAGNSMGTTGGSFYTKFFEMQNGGGRPQHPFSTSNTTGTLLDATSPYSYSSSIGSNYTTIFIGQSSSMPFMWYRYNTDF